MVAKTETTGCTGVCLFQGVRKVTRVLPQVPSTDALLAMFLDKIRHFLIDFSQSSNNEAISGALDF